MFKLAPSILAADFSRLAEQVRAAEEAGADYIHIDVMDGHFVPNISIGPLIVEACKNITLLPLDVHLMITTPERYIEAFAAAGADNITIHVEATHHLHRALQMIKDSGVGVGVTLNPLTPLASIKDALPLVDLVLIMSVNPGFGGQQFIESSLGRLEQVAAWKHKSQAEFEIEVDGGINQKTLQPVLAAGAEVIVAGSAIFNDHPVAENIKKLRSLAS